VNTLISQKLFCKDKRLIGELFHNTGPMPRWGWNGVKRLHRKEGESKKKKNPEKPMTDNTEKRKTRNRW